MPQDELATLPSRTRFPRVGFREPRNSIHYPSRSTRRVRSARHRHVPAGVPAYRARFAGAGWGDAAYVIALPGRTGRWSAHLRTDFRPRRPAATAPLRFGRFCSRFPRMCFCPVDRVADRRSVCHGTGGLDGDGHRISAVVRDSFEEADSSRIYSMLMLVIGIAPIISPSVGGQLLQFGGWGSIFWALASFACVCSVADRHRSSRKPHPSERRNRDSIATVFRRYGALLVDFQYMGYFAPVSLTRRTHLRLCSVIPVAFNAVLQTFTDSLQSGFRQQCRWLDWCRPGEPLAYPPPRYPHDPPGRVDRQCAGGSSASGPRMYWNRWFPRHLCRPVPVLDDDRAHPAQRDRRGDGSLSAPGRSRVGSARNASVFRWCRHGCDCRPLSRRDWSSHGVYNGQLRCGFSCGHNSN